jgi:hypothetical protein|tara:strand:+ start:840 stop:1043 length:204 start_codon:yes stop_codon:yes gene_type:complete
MQTTLGKQTEISIHDIKSVKLEEVKEFDGMNSNYYRVMKITSSDGQEYEINLFSKDGWNIYINELDD